MSNVLGFDPSLTSSGFSYYTAEGQLVTGRIRPKKLRGLERLDYIADTFTKLLDGLVIQHRCSPLLVYEGYAMGLRGTPGRFFDMGELGGVLKLIAYQKRVDVLLVPPSNLKKFATGKGDADKPMVMAAVAENWGASFKYNDEADAFALMRMGMAYMSRRPPRESYRRDALGNCKLIANNA